MSKKVYYDATNNKEVVDISGQKSDEEIENMGLTISKQMVEITDETTEATEVVNGVLQKFDYIARAEAENIAKEIARQASEDAFKSSVGWTDQQYQDFKDSLG